MVELKISEILNAISQPNRLRILKALREKKILCGCEMISKLGMEQSNLSRHLNTLVKAGVLRAWKKGVKMNYEIADERICNLIDLAENIVMDNLYTSNIKKFFSQKI